MARNVPRDHNYRTACPAAIKAKITQLESAAMDYAFVGSADLAERDGVLDAAQTARYDLERTILTCIDAAVKAALANRI